MTTASRGSSLLKTTFTFEINVTKKADLPQSHGTRGSATQSTSAAKPRSAMQEVGL